MSSLSLFNLKEDIKLLEKLYLKKISSNNDSNIIAPSTSAAASLDFPRTYPKFDESCSCFRLISASIDELVCELTDSNKKKYRVNANICV